MGITRFNQVLEGTDKYVPSDMPINLMERTLRKKQKEYDDSVGLVNKFNVEGYGLPIRPIQGDQDILTGHVNDYKDQMRETLKRYNGDAAAAKNELMAIAGNFFIDDKTKKLQQAKAVYDETQAFKQKAGESAYLFQDHLAPLADKDGNLQFMQAKYDKYRDVDKEIQDAVGKSFGFNDDGTFDYDKIDELNGLPKGTALAEYNQFITNRKFDPNTTSAQMFAIGVQQGNIRFNHAQVDKAYESAAQNILTNPEVVANTEIEADRISKAEGISLFDARKIYKDKILASLKSRADSLKTQLTKLPQIQSQVLQGQSLNPTAPTAPRGPGEDKKDPAAISRIDLGGTAFIPGGAGVDPSKVHASVSGKTTDDGSYDTDLKAIEIFKQKAQKQDFSLVNLENINVPNIGLFGAANIAGVFTPAVSHVSVEDLIDNENDEADTEQKDRIQKAGYGLTVNLGSSNKTENSTWANNHLRRMYMMRSATDMPTYYGNTEVVPNTTSPLNGEPIDMPYEKARVNTLGYFQVRDGDGNSNYEFGTNPTISRMYEYVNQDADALYKEAVKGYRASGKLTEQQVQGYAEREKQEYIKKVVAIHDTAKKAKDSFLREPANAEVISKGMEGLRVDAAARKNEFVALNILLKKQIGSDISDLENNPFISNTKDTEIKRASDYENKSRAKQAVTNEERNAAQIVSVDQRARAQVLNSIFGIKNAFNISSDVTNGVSFLGMANQRETVLDTAYQIAAHPELLEPKNKNALKAYMVQTAVKNGMFTTIGKDNKKITDWTKVLDFVNNEGFKSLNNALGIDLSTEYTQSNIPITTGGSISTGGSNFTSNTTSGYSTAKEKLQERLRNINSGKILVAGAGTKKDGSANSEDISAQESQYHLEDRSEAKVYEANKAYFDNAYIENVKLQFKDSGNKTATFMAQRLGANGLNKQITDALAWRNIINGRTGDRNEDIKQRVIVSTTSAATDRSYDELYDLLGGAIISNKTIYTLEKSPFRNIAPFSPDDNTKKGINVIGSDGSGAGMLSFSNELRMAYEKVKNQKVKTTDADGTVHEDYQTIGEFVRKNSSGMKHILHPEYGSVLAVTMTFNNPDLNDNVLNDKTLLIPFNASGSEDAGTGTSAINVNKDMYDRIVGTDLYAEHVIITQLAKQFKSNGSAPAITINGNMVLEVVRKRGRNPRDLDGYVYSIKDVNTGAAFPEYSNLEGSNILEIAQKFENATVKNAANVPDLKKYVDMFNGTKETPRNTANILDALHREYPALKDGINSRETLESLYEASKNVILEKMKSIPDGSIFGAQGDELNRYLKRAPLAKGDYFKPAPKGESYNMYDQETLNGQFIYSNNTPMLTVNKSQIEGVVLASGTETKLKTLLHATVGENLGVLTAIETVLNSSLRSFNNNGKQETSAEHSMHLTGQAVDFQALNPSGNWAGGFTEYSMKHILGLKPRKSGDGLEHQEISDEQAAILSEKLKQQGFYLLVHKPLHLHLEYNPAKAGQIKIEWANDPKAYTYAPKSKSK